MRAEARKSTPERSRPGRQITAAACVGFAEGLLVERRYRLERPLDRKQSVWLATDGAGELRVLKTGAADLIAHESRILSGLAHPHIVGILDWFETEGGACLVLEHLDGGDLVSLAGLPPAHWLAPLAQVVDALAYLHGRRLVHRDLKARNVRFNAAGNARLIDFGSAAAIGSPWSAGGTTPELVRPGRDAGAVVPADDVYALACLLYEMLHGQPPGGPSRARHVPASCRSLHALVEATIDSADSGTLPDLLQFATVIK